MVAFEPKADSSALVEGCYFLLFLALIFLACFNPDFKFNEIDVLPSVRQFSDSAWLPADWYLNLEVGYRNLFNGLIGPIVTSLDFLQAAYVVRLLLYIFVAGAYLYLVRALGLNFAYAAVVLVVFLYEQSLAAEEWIVGAVETKTLSYGFVLLGIGCLLRERIPLALACLGLAFSFHVLVGLYACFCIGIALLGTGALKTHFSRLIRNAWIFVLFGFNGFLFCYSQFVDTGVEGAQQAWREYVVFRVPHHAMPDAWKGVGHIILAPLLLACTLVAAKWGRHPAVRFLAWHSIGCVLLIGIGFLVYFFLDASYLRYYFFRYSDVMWLLGVALMVALGWQNFLGQDPSLYHSHLLRKLAGHRQLLQQVAGVVVVLVVLAALAWFYSKFDRNREIYALNLEDRRDRHDIAAWIQDNTEKADQFVINPAYGAFYIEAQRPAFVTFKHLPQLSIDIKEWLHRIDLLSAGELDHPGGFGAMKEMQERYMELEPGDIDRIAEEYDVQYFLTASEKDYPYPAVYTNGTYALYAITGATQ